jgi:Fe-S cluster biosynthesis and repair protein YggX
MGVKKKMGHSWVKVFNVCRSSRIIGCWIMPKEVSSRLKEGPIIKEPALLSPIHSLKRQVAQVYNKISQEMYGVGVKKQKIEIIDDKIVIFIREYKIRLKEQLEKLLNLKVATILKDYCPETEAACVVVYLKQ